MLRRASFDALYPVLFGRVCVTVCFWTNTCSKHLVNLKCRVYPQVRYALPMSRYFSTYDDITTTTRNPSSPESGEIVDSEPEKEKEKVKHKKKRKKQKNKDKEHSSKKHKSKHKKKSKEKHKSKSRSGRKKANGQANVCILSDVSDISEDDLVIESVSRRSRRSRSRSPKYDYKNARLSPEPVLSKRRKVNHINDLCVPFCRKDKRKPSKPIEVIELSDDEFPSVVVLSDEEQVNASNIPLPGETVPGSLDLSAIPLPSPIPPPSPIPLPSPIPPPSPIPLPSPLEPSSDAQLVPTERLPCELDEVKQVSQEEKTLKCNSEEEEEALQVGPLVGVEVTKNENISAKPSIWKKRHTPVTKSLMQNFKPGKEESDAAVVPSPRERDFETQANYIKTYLEGLRKWDYSSLGEEIVGKQSVCTDGVVFRVMSYNVLAQYLVEQFREELYNEMDERCLEWNYRIRRIIQEITEYMPDVVCLQEVQVDHYHSFFVPEMTNLQFLGIYKQRTGGKADGCAIFYKKEKFRALFSTSVEYHQEDAPTLDRDNIGLIVNLKPRKIRTNSWLTVATTHLLYNPRRYDVKLSQLTLLLAEVDRLAFWKFSKNGRPIYHATIITGDFNAVPSSNLYKFVVNGRLHYEGLSSKNLQDPNLGGFGRELDNELIPEELGITDNCQHVKVVERRKRDQLHSQQSGVVTYAATQEQLLSLVLLQHSDRTWGGRKPKIDGIGSFLQSMNADPATSPPQSPGGPFGSGSLRHHLRLSSVYSHKLKRLGERVPAVTTKQKQWQTVDYIFYGNYWNKSKRCREEGSLKLLGVVGLLAGNECEAIGCLPNAYCPSDHLPLVAAFLFKPSR